MFFMNDENNDDESKKMDKSENESTNESTSENETKTGEETSTEDNKDTNNSESDMSDKADNKSEESNSQGNDSKSEDKESKDESDDEESISIKDVISELTDADDSLQKTEDTINKIENAGGEVSQSDLDILKSENARQRESINILEWQLKKLYTDKADLTLKNAEMEAFGWNYKDPKLLIMIKNYDKASGGDDKAKEKVLSICRDMIESLTGVAQDNSDPIGAAAIYNKTSLKMPDKKDKEDENSPFLL